MYQYRNVFNPMKSRMELKLTYVPPPPVYQPNFNIYKPYTDPLGPIDSTGGGGAYLPSAVLLDGKFGKKMKIFTYVLFAYHVLYAITIITYSSLTINLEKSYEYLYFFFCFGLFELIYFISSILWLFIKKTIDDHVCGYSLIVIIFATPQFISSINDLVDSYETTTADYIVFIGTSSILTVMSLVYCILGIIAAVYDE